MNLLFVREFLNSVLLAIDIIDSDAFIWHKKNILDLVQLVYHMPNHRLSRSAPKNVYKVRYVDVDT